MSSIHSGIHWIIAIIILIFFHTTFFFETWVGTQVYLSRKFLVWLLWGCLRGVKKRYTNVITVQPWWITTTALDIHCTLYVECGYSSVVGVRHTVYTFYCSNIQAWPIDSIDCRWQLMAIDCQSIINRYLIDRNKIFFIDCSSINVDFNRFISIGYRLAIDRSITCTVSCSDIYLSILAKVIKN